MSDVTTQSEMQRLADEPVESLGDAAILDELPAVPDLFHVHDEASANWVVRHITEARARAARAKAFAAREVARAEKEEAFFLGRFGLDLEQWARGALTGKRKSVSLPAGDLAFRTAPERLAVDNDVELLAWAQEHLPAAVVVVPEVLKVSKAELAKEFKAHGVVPSGCHVEEAAEKFSVR